MEERETHNMEELDINNDLGGNKEAEKAVVQEVVVKAQDTKQVVVQGEKFTQTEPVSSQKLPQDQSEFIRRLFLCAQLFFSQRLTT